MNLNLTNRDHILRIILIPNPTQIKSKNKSKNKIRSQYAILKRKNRAKQKYFKTLDHIIHIFRYRKSKCQFHIIRIQSTSSFYRQIPIYKCKGKQLYVQDLFLPSKSKKERFKDTLSFLLREVSILRFQKILTNSFLC